jgi:methyl-accepting chemotaxis protein
MEWIGMDRRRLGTAMLVFGLIGLVLAGIVAGSLVAGGFAARNLDDKIVAGQNRIAASLTRLTLTMDSVATSIDNASTTLGTSRDGVVHAADALGQLADTADSLATSLDVTILGQQPFTSAVANLRTLEAKVRVFQDDAVKLAANLDQNANDVTTIAGEVRDMRSQVAELAGAVTGFANTREVVSLAVGGIVLGGLLTLWEAILAAGIAWMGWRLRRVAKTASASGATADPASEAGPTA